MLHKDKWPFTPENLSEIIDPETLAVIEAGCSVRFGTAMTLLDIDPKTEAIGRIDPINLQEKFSSFCALIRDDNYVHGGNRACEQCDINVVKSLARQKQPDLFRSYTCHLGVMDARYVVQVRGRTVAVLFAGQYRPESGVTQIQENVCELGTGHWGHIVPINESITLELLSRAEKLFPAPSNFEERLCREAEHIQRIAEAHYARLKNEWEQEFLEQLRAARSLGKIEDLRQIRLRVERLLQEIQRFCRCQYVVLFANVQEDDTVLTPIAHVGLTGKINERLPHFNWKKANFTLEHPLSYPWNITTERNLWLKGIRGDNSQHFANAACLLPMVLGNSYRGLLLLGPFVEEVNLTNEQPFLLHIARIVGWAVHTDLQLLNLHQQQKHWESTAKLMTHQVRTAITPITTQVATAKIMLGKPQTEANLKLLGNALKGARELCLRLGKTVGETVKSHVLLLEAEDLKFEPYPLSVLVANCVEAFTLEAESQQRQLVLDESVERLPHVEVDIARLTIGLSNLIDNAIKYSHPHTHIHVSASIYREGMLNFENVLIEIQNDGEQIAPDKLERIFEHGERGLTGAKLRRIPGTGLGLWEVRAVVEAHGGKIDVKCNPTAGHFRHNQAYRVVFTIQLPLRQEK